MFVLSSTDETLTKHDPVAARKLLELSGSEKTVDDESSPAGNGKIHFKLYSREQMQFCLDYQGFLKERGREDQGSWLPVSDVYWGQGHHSRFLVNVDDIDVFRIEHI